MNYQKFNNISFLNVMINYQKKLNKDQEMVLYVLKLLEIRKIILFININYSKLQEKLLSINMK